MPNEVATESKFSRRESEVMNVLFQRESATARDVWSALGESRTYSTIRKILSILEEKGHVRHKTKGSTFIYSPVEKREKAASSALGRLVDTFFQGSVEGAVSSLLGDTKGQLSSDELDRIGAMIEDAKQQTKDKK